MEPLKLVIISAFLFSAIMIAPSEAFHWPFNAKPPAHELRWGYDTIAVDFRYNSSWDVDRVEGAIGDLGWEVTKLNETDVFGKFEGGQFWARNAPEWSEGWYITLYFRVPERQTHTQQELYALFPLDVEANRERISSQLDQVKTALQEEIADESWGHLWRSDATP